jgi:isocitrate/isopropylmalate dehydrogenase
MAHPASVGEKVLFEPIHGGHNEVKDKNCANQYFNFIRDVIRTFWTANKESFVTVFKKRLKSLLINHIVTIDLKSGFKFGTNEVRAILNKLY